MTLEEAYKLAMRACEETWNEKTCKQIKDALEQQSRKGEWLRMSNLSEQEDDRYKCSCCGNVVHYRDKIDLYTFNSWCGRCGSDNRRKLRDENDK